MILFPSVSQIFPWKNKIIFWSMPKTFFSKCIPRCPGAPLAPFWDLLKCPLNKHTISAAPCPSASCPVCSLSPPSLPYSWFSFILLQLFAIIWCWSQCCAALLSTCAGVWSSSRLNAWPRMAPWFSSIVCSGDLKVWEPLPHSNVLSWH